jgi:hypothetical protein
VKGHSAVIRIYAIRLSGALLLLAAVCIAVLVLPNLIPTMSILWDELDSVIVVENITLSAMLALGLLGLLLAQPRWSGRLSALAALLGLLLYGALLLPRAIGMGALNVALTGAGLLAPLYYAPSFAVPLPLLALETLAALLLIGGLIACGLAARRGLALRWWWAPLALGVWSLVMGLLYLLVILLLEAGGAYSPQTSPQPLAAVFAGYIIFFSYFVTLLLWALLAMSLLTAPSPD